MSTLLIDNRTGITTTTELFGDFLNLYLRENPEITVIGISSASSTQYYQSNTQVILSTTNLTTIESSPIDLYRSIKSQVQISQGSLYQASDIMIIHDDINSSIIEQASTATSNYLADFSTTIQENNAVLQVKLVNPGNASIKIFSLKYPV
jgi:hypothetical protein